ncbi:MAG: ABC transporter permease [Candidatus Njordarchaeales archaeon]
MPSALVNIIKKELREIFRDPRLFLGMILVPLIMFPIMGIAMKGIMSSAMEKSYEEATLGILNLDEGSMADQIIGSVEFKLALQQYNITIVFVNESGVTKREDIPRFLSENRTIQAVIVIPENFTECINNQTPTVVEVYIGMRDISFAASSVEDKVQIFIDVLRKTISYVVMLSSNPNINPVFIENPILPIQNTIYKGKVLRNISPSAIASILSFQAFMIPIAMMVLLTIAIQFAAISIASEKEQKTLETLLSLPVNRSTILLGKLTGSLIVSLVGTIGYMLGFQYYMSSITESMPIEQVPLEAIGLGIDAIGYILLAISLFLSLLSTLSMVTILAAFAEDVRSAQSLTGILILPITLIALFSMFAVSFGTIGPWIYILLVIPFSNPMVTPYFIMNKTYLPVILGMVALIIETLISFQIAARFYSSEKILTARIRFGKRREKT